MLSTPGPRVGVSWGPPEMAAPFFCVQVGHISRRHQLRGEAQRRRAEPHGGPWRPPGRAGGGSLPRVLRPLPAASADRRAVPGPAGGPGPYAEGDAVLPAERRARLPGALRPRSARRCVQVGHISRRRQLRGEAQRRRVEPHGGLWRPPGRAGGGSLPRVGATFFDPSSYPLKIAQPCILFHTKAGNPL